MAGEHDSRLTDSDRAVMGTAVRAAVAGWGSSRVAGTDAVTLVRIAAHAIGCSLYDLRDSELVWIEMDVAVVLAG